jgi:mRNA interferase RelE/StbE
VGYAVSLTPKATKLLEDLPRAAQQRIAERLAWLAAEPHGAGVSKVVSAAAPVYRAKAGRDYRIVFAVDDAAREVLVVWVGNRRDAYRQR